MKEEFYKKTSLILAGLWLLTIGLLAYFFVFGMTEPSQDNRQVVQVTVAEKQFLLSEMRQLLEAMQRMHVELGKGNREQAALAAESVGMQMVRDLAAIESKILVKLPVPMKELGLGTHSEFDRLAETIRSDASDREIQAEIGKLMSRCVACHASYKLP